MIELHNPADMPDPSKVDHHLEEPRIKATILVPDEYLGDVLKLCQDRRGIQDGSDLCGQPRHGRSMTCRSMRWSLTSTTA